jgi:hypothetical protein
MQPRKAIIHIGPVKTGSSTIQTFLLRNHEVLKSRGVFVPVIGNTGHWSDCCHYPLYGIACHQDNVHFTSPSQKCEWHNIRKKLFCRGNEKIFFDGVLDMPFPLTILTFEGLSELAKKDIAHLKEYLDSHFQEYTIIAFLRRQSEWLVSWYSQLVTSGMSVLDEDFDEFIASYFYDQDRNFDNYQVLLERWGQVFGRENVKPRIFDRKEMIQNDLLTDFSSISGIDMDGLVRVEPQMASIDAETAEFMRLLSLHFPMRSDKSHISRTRLSVLVMKLFSQSGNVGYRLNRSQALAILDKYRESNNAVAREYFGRDTLFSDDVSAYPEELSPHHLDLEKAVEISATIIEELYKEIEKSCNVYEKTPTEHVTLHDEYKKLYDEYQKLHDEQRKSLYCRILRLSQKIKKLPHRFAKFLKERQF